MDYEAAVLGLGAVGSATLYQLVQRGVKAVGVDRWAPPHVHGSTHGDSRITRLAIGEGLDYSPLVLRSHQLWREIGAATDQPLLESCGGLILSADPSLTHHNAHDSFLETTVASARLYGIEHELLEAAEVSRRWPAFKLSGPEQGYYEPLAGWVRPEAAVAAQLQLAQQHGASLRLNTEVAAVGADGEGALLRLASGETVRADRLVVCAGAWVRELVPQLADHLYLTRQVLYWFELEPESAESLSQLPVFIWDPSEDEQDSFYGFPAVNGLQGGMKIAGGAHETRVEHPGSVERRVSPQEIAAAYARWGTRIRGLGPAPVKTATCLYTAAVDGRFVIDAHPQHAQVMVASPCSGHGFKHSAAIGEALAQWVCDGRSQLDLSGFGLSRFSG